MRTGTPAPVSYTHLDVYKRQIFGIKVRNKIHYVYPNGRQPEDEILRDTIQSLGLNPDDKDVYKRQITLRS